MYNIELYQSFFDNTGQYFIRQFVIPKDLCRDILFRLHNSKFMRHIGPEETATKLRQKFFFPEFTKTVLDNVSICSSCLQTKSMQQKSLRTPLLPIASLQCFAGDLLEVDVVGKLNPTGCYTDILSDMDVFTRFLFVVPMNTVAETVAKILYQVFMQHS